jgi:hypothetical protein
MTDLAVVGAGDRAHHLVSQVYAVRNREYRFAAADEWSLVGEEAYRRYAPDPPGWAESIGEATRPASPTDAKKAAALAVGAQQSVEHGPFYRIDDSYDVEAE